MDSAGLRFINSPESNAVPLWLVTINYPGWGVPLYFVRNNEPITSRGNVYVPTKMRVEMGSRQDDRPLNPKLVIDAVDKNLLDKIRSIAATPGVSTQPEVKIELILNTSPDVVQQSIEGATITSVPWTATSLEATLEVDNLLNIAGPADLFTPYTTPAVFG